MANISTQLLDLAIIRSVLLQRIANNLSAEVAGAYQNIIDDISRDIRGATPITLKNMNATIKELKERFEVDISFLNKDLEDLAVTESAYALNSVNSTVGVDIFSKVPPESTIRNIVATGLISDGKRAEPIKAWLKGIDAKMINDIEGVVKNGVIQGQVNSEIASNLSNVLGVSRGHAETITRTATSMVSNQAREAVYQSNQDVIKGYEFMATIDGRTSFGCSTRDGALYDTNRKGLNAKGKQFPYQPVPRHMNCRSIYSPVMKTWKELGLPFDEIPKGTRSSLDGQISADTNFDKWFEGKGKAFQEKYLGKGRYDLYKSGKISFKDLVNQKGETLSVSELTALTKKPTVPKVVKPKVPSIKLPINKKLSSVQIESISSLDDLELITYGNKAEHAGVFRQDGTKLFIKKGGRASVNFTGIESLYMNDSILTHNHPNSFGFSAEDLHMAVTTNLKEIRAVGEKYTYRLLRPKDGWKESVSVPKSFLKFSRNKYRTNEFSEIGIHNATKEIAEAYNLEYVRELI